MAAVVPDVPHLPEALRLAKFALDKKEHPVEMNTYGGLLYRKGDFAKAENIPGHVDSRPRRWVHAFDWVFLAMAQHRLSKPEARKSLERAGELAKTVQGWYNKAELRHLLAEAEQVLKSPHKP